MTNAKIDKKSEKPPASVAAAAPAPKPSKTPLYSAFNASRYMRQQLIKQIEEETGAKLLCYMATAEIDRDDVMFFVDLIHNVPKGSSIDLLLHTPGGDVDAAEKLIELVRNRKGDGKFRVIVPDRAKSAGTLIALGADTIVMSDTSELGTIDPQYIGKDAHGNEVHLSVFDYLSSYETYAEQLRKDPNDPAARAMFEKFDPAVLNKFKQVKSRARIFGENQLKRHGTTYTAIVAQLMDTKTYPSHGQMIGADHAKQMGLQVDVMQMDEPLWQSLWQLYCHFRLALTQPGISKMFESAYASNSE
ncbi:hypothetical protein [Mesorhizobium sp. M0968]|uniref:SDH family Clp fold serine proteinase n=1 Tax=Mesorhizobium sp. M0968 TaxID=2957037 RepID=UPI003337BD0C